MSAPAPVLELASTGYPLELVARPLVLPEGSVEGGADLVWLRSWPGDNVSLITAIPRLRFAAPGVELMGQAAIGIHHTQQPVIPGMTVEIERLQSIGGGLRHGFGPGAAIGAVFEIRLPATDLKSYNGRAFAAMKRRLGARSALELAGFVGGTRTRFAVTTVDSVSQDQLQFGGELRVQAQLSSVVAAEARTSLTLRKYLDLPYGGDTTYVGQDHGVRLVAAVNRDVDVIAGFDVVESDSRVVQFTLGVVARRLP